MPAPLSERFWPRLFSPNTPKVSSTIYYGCLWPKLMIYEIHTNKKHINTMTAPDEVCESIKRHFVQTCINTFPKTPYTWQTNVGSFILGCHLLTSPLKLLLVRPTGGGKTLVFTSVAACIKGITLCITPLLSLGADQVQKVMCRKRPRQTSP